MPWSSSAGAMIRTSCSVIAARVGSRWNSGRRDLREQGDKRGHRDEGERDPRRVRPHQVPCRVLAGALPLFGIHRDHDREFAITANPEGTLGREADVCLTLPRAEEACPNGLAPTTTTTMQLAIGDALAVALLRVRASPPRISAFPSRRQARRTAHLHPRHHAWRRSHAEGAAPHPHRRRDGRNLGQGLRLRRHRR